MKIPLAKTKFFDRGGFSGNVYVDKEEGKSFSALLVHCVTGHYKTRLKDATRVYIVTEGSGSFTINGKEESAELYDLFIISDGDTYEYHGKMRLFEINVPATDEDNEEVL